MNDYQIKELLNIEEERKKREKPKKKIEKIIKSDEIISFLKSNGYEFRMKRCNDEIEVNGRRLTDPHESEIRLLCRDNNVGGGKDHIHDCIVKAANYNSYHPIKEYLEKIKHDGYDNIRELSRHFRISDKLIDYDDGSTDDPFFVYLKKFLVGAIAKVYEGGQNCMLVLVGGQGLGKSYFADWLCSSIPEYFIESSLYGNEKDNDINSISHFLWEVGELDATTRKADVSALKAFISRKTVTVRAPYGRFTIKKPAMSSFIGTVNPGSGFLSDETGNRRFMCVSIDHVDFDYCRCNVDQVWAEAYRLYLEGYKWELSESEREYQSEENRKFDVDNPLEGWIEDFFTFTSDDNDFLKTSDVIGHLENNGVRMTGSQIKNGLDIARAMERLGIERSRRGKGRGYRGLIIKGNR